MAGLHRSPIRRGEETGRVRTSPAHPGLPKLWGRRQSLGSTRGGCGLRSCRELQLYFKARYTYIRSVLSMLNMSARLLSFMCRTSRSPHRPRRKRRTRKSRNRVETNRFGCQPEIETGVMLNEMEFPSRKEPKTPSSCLYLYGSDWSKVWSGPNTDQDASEQYPLVQLAFFLHCLVMNVRIWGCLLTGLEHLFRGRQPIG